MPDNDAVGRLPLVAGLAICLAALLAASPPRAALNEAASTVRFMDITDISGITFRHNSAPEKKYIVESMSGGLALFDYDNDGYLDIFFVKSLTVALVKSKERSEERRVGKEGRFRGSPYH